MISPSCPSQAELSEFLTGKLAGPAFERIADHVAHCPRCEKAMDACEDWNDSFVSRLRQRPQAAAPAGSPLPEELLRALRSIPQRPAGLYSLSGLSRLGK